MPKDQEKKTTKTNNKQVKPVRKTIWKSESVSRPKPWSGPPVDLLTSNEPQKPQVKPPAPPKPDKSKST